MGLDIHVYRQLKIIGHAGGAVPDGSRELYAIVEEDLRLRPFKKGDIVAPDQAIDFGFRVGPYSTFGEYRRFLCVGAIGVEPKLVWENPDAYRDRAFYELINFGDNEGWLGTKACVDLRDDYARDGDSADRRAFEVGMELLERTSDVERQYFRQVDDDFRRAFEAASDGGAISFA